MAGQPTKLTPELAEQIVKAIEAGNYNETAAEAAGIDLKTFYNWMNWGRDGKEPFTAFFQSVTRARANAELDLVDAVRAGDGKGEGFGRAKAAAFMLERTRAKKFAQRINVKVQDELERMLDVAQRVLAAEDFGRLLEAIAADDRTGETGEAQSTAGEQVH
jgi:hypothetical protein